MRWILNDSISRKTHTLILIHRFIPTIHGEIEKNDSIVWCAHDREDIGHYESGLSLHWMAVFTAHMVMPSKWSNLYQFLIGPSLVAAVTAHICAPFKVIAYGNNNNNRILRCFWSGFNILTEKLQFVIVKTLPPPSPYYTRIHVCTFAIILYICSSLSFFVYVRACL